jgi:hypothetical protein
MRPQRPWAAIAAATVLNLPLGSIYAFSVFLKPIESELGLNRSAMWGSRLGCFWCRSPSGACRLPPWSG